VPNSGRAVEGHLDIDEMLEKLGLAKEIRVTLDGIGNLHLKMRMSYVPTSGSAPLLCPLPSV
jgi:hypothetical protein